MNLDLMNLLLILNIFLFTLSNIKLIILIKLLISLHMRFLLNFHGLNHILGPLKLALHLYFLMHFFFESLILNLDLLHEFPLSGQPLLNLLLLINTLILQISNRFPKILQLFLILFHP